ncbi:unnamed protein product [Protopolystoma xenopodis]|uniref:Carboxylesterase type B domain-containing protein n=1 Tax=Protopolystoma xenopodis TaxID=117903 RepID=A0A448WVK1_9PLAT|nr:unnamed protein product [Protopolystoma xenopodis]
MPLCVRPSQDGLGDLIGSFGACLTLSMHFRRPRGVAGPGLIHLSGQALLFNTPHLVAVETVASTAAGAAGDRGNSLATIYVSVNYRLGVLGFASFGSHHSWPNQAVHDVRLALTWLHKHADKLGLARRKVLLMAEDAGATIAGLLYTTTRPGDAIGTFTQARTRAGSPHHLYFCPQSPNFVYLGSGMIQSAFQMILSSRPEVGLATVDGRGGFSPPLAYTRRPSLGVSNLALAGSEVLCFRAYSAVIVASDLSVNRVPGAGICYVDQVKDKDSTRTLKA